ncbi:MAG: exosortase C-terminal domain/associated protein EpsI [Parvularculaceae bacterium]
MTALARSAFMACLMALASAATAVAVPQAGGNVAAPNLEAMLPSAFGSWRQIALADAVLPSEQRLGPGEAVAYRAYRDDIGRTVTLVAAYGPPLGDSVRLHRPETCYGAQGFVIRATSTAQLSVGADTVPIVNLDAQSPARREAVTYWLREGARYSVRAADSQWQRFAGNLSSPVDGALVRVSTISADRPQFDLNEAFMADFAAALGADARALLLGDGAPL